MTDCVFSYNILISSTVSDIVKGGHFQELVTRMLPSVTLVWGRRPWLSFPTDCLLPKHCLGQSCTWVHERGFPENCAVILTGYLQPPASKLSWYMWLSGRMYVPLAQIWRVLQRAVAGIRQHQPTHAQSSCSDYLTNILNVILQPFFEDSEADLIFLVTRIYHLISK